MTAGEIRAKFLEFFRAKGHTLVASDSLVPKADPTLLFTSAGMNQFKEQFLGHNVSYKRAASSQKCLRTADLEKVGKTPSHHTFFEMLGNFSFGDYFKKEAIAWAWEFMTEELGLDPKKLRVSVYEDDGESYAIWRNSIKVPEKKILKLGAKENFWPANAPLEGPNGPCGPCSEIFYDYAKGKSVEVWNLVFTQFDRKGKKRLEPLPNKNIDTGMGLERIAAVMQGVETNFETDIFKPIIEEIRSYRPKLKAADLNAIADHIRAVTFAIADGVPPSNEERGYVIRKLIRRAYLRGGGEEAFLYYIVPKVVGAMKDGYPELLEKREEVGLIVKEEEERFEHTLSAAMPILEENLRRPKGNVLGGGKIFKLVDTYGLPLEVIEEKAKKRKVKLALGAFKKLMKERREISREKSKIEQDIFALNLFTKAPKTPRSDKLPLKAKIAFLVKGKAAVKKASVGDIVEVMTNPQAGLFYTEAGGQVGDTGNIEVEAGSGSGSGLLRITNTVSVDTRVIHVGEMVKGELKTGDTVRVELDTERKGNIAKNHTATHLLHGALREVLGGHVHQAGSLVAPDRFRFDFTHIKKLTDRELEKVESLVNDRIKNGIRVKKEEKPLSRAKEEGAIALFGEKYDGNVKVISCGDFSKEVCGGTHVDDTGDIGLFKIVRESSVASGVRRIEAVTSDRAREWLKESEKRKTKSEKQAREKEEAKALEREKLKKAGENIEEIIEKAQNIKGVKVIIQEVKGANMGVLRGLADRIKAREKSFFVVLGSAEGGKANIVLSVAKDLVSSGVDASKLIKDLAKIADGSGGGRPDFAQAGGRDTSKLSKVFEFAGKRAADIIGGIR
jgi:alanyl-tRNA synthetase